MNYARRLMTLNNVKSLLRWCKLSVHSAEFNIYWYR